MIRNTLLATAAIAMLGFAASIGRAEELHAVKTRVIPTVQSDSGSLAQVTEVCWGRGRGWEGYYQPYYGGYYSTYRPYYGYTYPYYSYRPYSTYYYPSYSYYPYSTYYSYSPGF